MKLETTRLLVNGFWIFGNLTYVILTFYAFIKLSRCKPFLILCISGALNIFISIISFILTLNRIFFEPFLSKRAFFVFYNVFLLIQPLILLLSLIGMFMLVHMLVSKTNCQNMEDK